MSKIIISVSLLVLIIAGGIAGYFYFTKSSKELKEFAKGYEKTLNDSLIKIEEEIDSLYRVGNMLKLKSKPFVCSTAGTNVTCISDRIYLGGPFFSYEIKNGMIVLAFDIDNNTVSSKANFNGVFDIENSRYTNDVQYGSSVECFSESKYIPEKGVLENRNDTCKSNFGTITFNVDADSNYKSENIVNVSIYDALLSYVSLDDFNKATTSDDYQGLLKSLSINIESPKGLFNNVYDYITDISKRNIDREFIRELYKELRLELYTAINQEISNMEEDVQTTVIEFLQAIDDIVLNDNKNIQLNIIAKDKDKYYTENELVDVEDLFNMYSIEIKSE